MVLKKINAEISDIQWIAPLRDSLRSVMIATPKLMAVLNLDTEVKSTEFLDGRRIVKYSKSIDPHLILQNLTEGRTSLVYTTGIGISTKTFTQRSNSILSSHLDIPSNTWIVAENPSSSYDPFSNTVQRSNESQVLQFSFTGMGVKNGIQLKPDTQVQLNSKFVFTLHPTKLGYATLTELETNQTQEVRGFNVRDL